MDKRIVTIDTDGNGFEHALEITDSFGKNAGLSDKESLRLHLLGEELIGLMRGTAGGIKADYSVEREGRSFILSLEGDVKLDAKIQKELLEAATNGKNNAASTFTGMIKVMIGNLTLPGTLGHTFVSGLSMGLISMGSPTAGLESNAGTEAYMWSMEKYMDSANGNEDRDIKDTFERSIVANIADDVKVSIVKPHVLIEIYKAF